MSSRYAAAHLDPQGEGDARPTALQIIQDEGLTGKLADKVIVITGATSGIGLETARALSATGAKIFLTVRDTATAEKSLQDILEPERVSLIEMDNNSLKSVRPAAAEILAKSNGKVNILIENAGIMGMPREEMTEDGHEMHFQTNFLAHFLLFHALRDGLIAAATPSSQSRVVIVASSAHRAATVIDHNRPYDAQYAYSVSNLAKVYLANEINRRYSAKGIFANSLHPGGIGGTNMSRYVGQGFVDWLYSQSALLKLFKSAEQGAATTVLAAVGKEFEGVGGKYLEDCAVAKRGEDDGNGFSPGYVKQTYDADGEERLWKGALKMVGIPEDS